jgi:hypothetical protein
VGTELVAKSPPTATRCWLPKRHHHPADLKLKIGFDPDRTFEPISGISSYMLFL